MLSTFKALADFPENENVENEQQSGENASVDLSSVINRLNDMENKINQIINAQTAPPEIPTHGNEENIENNSEEEKNNESNTSG